MNVVLRITSQRYEDESEVGIASVYPASTLRVLDVRTYGTLSSYLNGLAAVGTTVEAISIASPELRREAVARLPGYVITA